MSFRPGELLLNIETKEIFEVVKVKPWLGMEHPLHTMVFLKGKNSGIEMKAMSALVKQNFIKSNMWTLLLYG